MSSKRQKRKRFDSASANHQQLDPATKEQIHKLFHKKFTYKKPQDDSWKFKVVSDNHDNSAKCQSWTKIGALKQKLNKLKDLLSDKDIINWHNHTKGMHLAGGVMADLKIAHHVEMCTQAWCKFHEILSEFEIVPMTTDLFGSVHLCEAPGAFVTSLNHYLKQHDIQEKWQWLATTLNPYYEGNSLDHMIDDDRFVSETLTNWYFGQDGTGNLMNSQNVEDLCQEARKRLTDVLLVTADGSIDCQDRPSEQEVLVSRLHYFETFSALKLLKSGGSFVLKIFTMFEVSTIQLLYLLNCCFEKVNIFKPATSKPGNSEVYVVCQRYTADTDTIITFFIDYLHDVRSSNHLDIPESFINQHAECCEYFVTLQMETIETNMDTYRQHVDHLEKRHLAMKEYCQEFYVSKLNIRQIPLYSRIVAKNKEKRVSSFKLDRQMEPILRSPLKSCNPKSYKCSVKAKHQGSFYERQNKSKLPWHDRLEQMDLFDPPCERLTLECTTPIEVYHLQEWSILKGRRVDQIESSQFCWNKLINCLNDVLDNRVVSGESNQDSPDQLVTSIIDILTSDCDGDKPVLFCVNGKDTIMKHFDNSEELDVKFLAPENLSTVKGANIFFPIMHLDHSKTSDQNDCPLSNQHIDKDDLEVEGQNSTDVSSTNNGNKINLSHDKSDPVIYSNDQDKNPEGENGSHFVHSAITDDQSLSIKRGQIDSSRCGHFETEEWFKLHLLQTLLNILKYIQGGNCVLLELPLALTRFTAGVVYILTRCFIKSSMKSVSSSTCLRQILYLQVFTGSSSHLINYIEEALEHLNVQSDPDLVLLELLPLSQMKKDVQFTKFLTHTNKCCLIEFLNSAISEEKSLLKHKMAEQG